MSERKPDDNMGVAKPDGGENLWEMSDDDDDQAKNQWAFNPDLDSPSKVNKPVAADQMPAVHKEASDDEVQRLSSFMLN